MKRILLFLCLLNAITIQAQELYFTAPVKIPLFLSGSFAELRGNHFHSGIDIKTKGSEGLPVFAVAEGYVSRIVVSPTGFGKALYINHPNGTTSVYAHLQQFNPKITEYVKDIQYEKKSFRVDLSIPSYLFPVQQEEEIAKSGNSGSSGGPHLHFEIRDTKTEEPVNPLKYNFPVNDNIAPSIFSVLVVPLSNQSHIDGNCKSKSFPVVFYDEKYHLRNNPTVAVSGKIGLAIHANDYFNGSYNKCGVNLLRMSVNEQTYFTFQINRFAFDNSRYINSHIVYGEYEKSNLRYIKTWLDPGNRLPIYNHNGTEGILTVKPGTVYKVDIELQDSYGNSSIVSFQLKGEESNAVFPTSHKKTLFPWNRNNGFKNGSVNVSIPRGALYSDLNFEYSSESSSESFFCDYHFIHNKSVPLHTPATIGLKLYNVPRNLESKLVMVNVDTLSGEYHAMGGSFQNGWIRTQTRTLGVYSVTADTIPPDVISLSIKNNQLKEPDRIRFTISDDLSGIKSIVGLINGKWALFEYDPKIKRITHHFDKKRFEFNKQHTLELTVTDQRNNSRIYRASFWK